MLAIAFGEATKTLPVAQEGLKTYRFTIRLGQATDTDDAEGAVIAESPARPGDAAIRAALAPMSARSSRCRRSSPPCGWTGRGPTTSRAEGERLDLAPRRALQVAALDLVARPDADHAELELVCGKGGYVRAIARDLGRDLGCHAHVAALRRTAAGPFTLDHAIGWDALEALHGPTDPPLLPVAAALAELPEIPVTAAAAAQLRNGQPVPVAASLDWDTPVWASSGGLPVALGRVRAGRLQPERVIAPPADRTAPGFDA